MNIVNGKVDVLELRQILVEMRTPTQAIRGFAGYNEEEKDLAEIRENNKMILKAGNDLIEMLNEHIDKIDNK